MLMDEAEAWAIVPNAVVKRTMEVPSLEGLDTETELEVLMGRGQWPIFFFRGQ